MKSIVLLLAITALAAAQSSLNVSHDLTTLKIAPQNMTPDLPTLDSQPLLTAAIAYSQLKSIPLVTADPGAYYFLTPASLAGQRYLNFTNLQNLTLDLAFSDLYFQSASWSALWCTNCQNVTFQNFTMDALKLPYTQVQVTSVDIKNNRINYSAIAGFDPPTAFNTVRNPAGGAIEPLYAFDFRSGAPVRTTSRMSVQRPIDPGYLPIVSDVSPWSNPAQLANIQAGDVLVLTARAGTAALTLNGGSNNTLRNISVYYGSQVAVNVGASTNTLVEQIQVIPRPGTNRLISSNADGITAIQLGANLTIRRSRIMRNCDDGISPNSQQLGLVKGQPLSSTTTVTLERAGYSNPPDGLQVQFIDNKTGLVAATTHILSQDPPYSTALPVSGSTVTLTVDSPLPTLAGNDAMVYADPNFRGAGLLLQNNLVQDGVFARGISLWGLLGGTIQGNMIRNTSWSSAIDVLESSSTNSWLTGPVANLTVQNNAIEQYSGAFGTAVENALAAIEVESVNATGAQVSGSPFQNVTIRNNFISSGPYSGINFGNVNGGAVTGNLLMNVANNPTLNSPSALFAQQVKQPIALENNINVASAPNTVDTTIPVAYVVSSISFSQQAIAPNSWAAVLGTNLAPKLDLAVTSPLPTSFDGMTVTIADSAGVSTNAPILFISASQINFLVPANIAQGAAVITVTSGGTVTGRGAILIDSLAPALFSANGSGTGLALGAEVLTHADGTQVYTSLSQPVDLGKTGDIATLVLYATGIRNGASLNNVSVILGGTRLPVLYAGPQGAFDGLDQINLVVPAQFRGAGNVALQANVNGIISNALMVTIN